MSYELPQGNEIEFSILSYDTPFGNEIEFNLVEDVDAVPTVPFQRVVNFVRFVAQSFRFRRF